MAKSSSINYHKLFHRNMLALMTFNCPTKALRTCFKEGMFSCPNQDGFVQVSYFLINIIYPGTKAFKSCWPILDRSQERAFRAALIVLIRGLNDDFGDIYPISYVVPARLMSPGGDRFMKIMWELSILALGVHTKRESRDSECFFLQKPPMTAPQNLRNKARLILQAQTKANLKECEAKLSELEERMNNYKELKGRMVDKMFVRDKKMRERESYAVKLFKESDLEVALVSKLLDLKNNKGILELEARVKQKEIALAEKLQHCQDTSSLARETKYILEAAIKQEHNSHKILLDASCISGSETISGATENVRTGHVIKEELLCKIHQLFETMEMLVEQNLKVKANGIDASLLEHVCDLRDRFKALKLAMEECHLSGCLSGWKSICKEKELLESDLRKLESELEKKLLDLSSWDEKNTAEGVSENDFQASPSLIVPTTASTSTPIKNMISISSDSGFHTSVTITPHQPATNQDFFSVKLAEAQKEISDDKVGVHQKATNTKSNDSSIDELLERFRKIVEIREQRSCDHA